MSMPLRAAAYSLLFFLLMLLYGGRVCPFVDGLTVWRWAAVLAAGYALAYAARLALAPKLVWRADPWRQGTRQFRLEMGLALALGIGVSLYNAAVFDFPLGSGMKMLLGILSFGFFMALDMALMRDLEVAATARAAGTRPDPQLSLSSATRKATLLASSWAVFNTLVVALVVSKDLQYLRAVPREAYDAASLGVVAEIVFVGLVFLGLTLRVLWTYGRVQRFAFAMQTEVLEAVGRGELDRTVPVVTADEFGLIARKTNEMIRGLREKERLQSAFGKLVDPQVASRLLDAGDAGMLLGGERRELVIMLVDIRDFTKRVERGRPEGVVEDLNLFFSVAVKVIGKHGGMVDKFLGDGVLAVFGLEPTQASAAGGALQAARELLRSVRTLDPVLRKPIRIGVGLDAGAVISGLIGSPERLEFTVIGDAVNTASRLEGLTKRLDTPVMASRAFQEAVAEPELRAMLAEMGEHRVRGKREPVRVWGLADPQEAQGGTADSGR